MLLGRISVLALLALFVYCCCYYVATQLLYKRRSKQNSCVSPRHLPQIDRLFGLDLILLQLRKRASKKLLVGNVWMHNRYGQTFTATAMMRKFIVTNEPKNIQAVLATNFTDYSLGARFLNFGPLLGRGIFTADGQHWTHSRNIIRPNFAKMQIAKLEDYETLVQQLIDLIPKDGSPVDLQPLFFRLTFDSSTALLFGKSAGTLHLDQPGDARDFAESFDYAQTQLSLRSRLLELVRLYRSPKFDRACKTVHGYVDNLVQRTLAERETVGKSNSNSGPGSQKPGAAPYVLLDEIINEIRDPKRIRSELLNVLLAGRDTTAGLLSATFFILARRSDVWNKLQSEIKSLEGKKPDYNTLMQLKYVRYVINEALRLYPPVPVNSREAIKDTILPTGGGSDGKSQIFICKGTTVYYSVFALHRRKDIYGPDALEFRPERWESLRPGWAYLPFNGGPRICIGQQLALTNAAYTIVRLLQTFSTIRAIDSDKWREHLHLTLSVDNGVNVVMSPTQ